MQHSCCKDCEPGKSRKTKWDEKVFDANKDTMVQYSCSAVCEPGKLGKNRKSGEWFWSNGSMQHDTDHNQASRLFLRFSNEAESFPGPWDSWSEIIGEQLKPPALIKSIFPSHAWPWKQVLAKFHSSPATTRSWQLHNSLMKMRAGPAMDACYQEWASFTDPSLWDSLEPKSAQRLKLTWLKTKSFGNIWNKQQDSKSRF